MKKKLGILSVFLGNLFEHYDTALYGLLSPFLAPIFFPTEDPVTALILTYGMIPLSMIIRPLGSLLFGYIGDYYGRQQALYISMSGMAFISLSIALLPDFSQIGFLAPLFLLIGRMLLSFFASGETSGGAVYLLENSSESKQDIMSGYFGSSTIAGIILASALVTLFSHFGMIENGWRILYLIGGFTGVCGMILRRRSKTVSIKKPHLRNPLKTIWEMRSIVATIAVTTGFSYANYSISLGVINGFIPLVTDITKTEIMQLNTYLLVLDFATLPLLSMISTKFSRVHFMAAAALTSVCVGIPLFACLEGASLTTVIAVRVTAMLLGVWFSSTFHSWTLNLVQKEHRYLIISFGSAVGALLFGGPTAAISLWIYQQTGIVSAIAWYWVALGLLSSALMLRLEKTKIPVKI